MANVTAQMVKELREMTGAGMMDCKNALAETNGDMEAAVDFLRKKGLAKAAKKAGRVAAEGLVGFWVEGARASVVEVNSETDFVARNEQFQGLVKMAAHAAFKTDGTVEATLAAKAGEATIADAIASAVATIGENMTLRRSAVLSVGAGAIGSYMHNSVDPGLGKIGVLVALSGGSEAEIMETLGRQIGMHVAAAKPDALDIDAVDPAALEREKAVLTEQARGSGKPDAIIAKMVEGRIRKYYEEVVLLEQVWVHDGESRVRAVVAKAGLTLHGFDRFALGEGVDRGDGPDFASEVAAAAGLPPT